VNNTGERRMKKNDIKGLVAAARAAQRNAYAPYSKFPVGAALLADDGTVVTGCNVENSSYGLSCCAERNAVSAAVSCGKRGLVAVAIAADTAVPVAPCGACRQVLSEFNPRMTVVMVAKDGRTKTARLDRMLPYAFGPRQLRTDTKKKKT
jgi:cytidine deaminase